MGNENDAAKDGGGKTAAPAGSPAKADTPKAVAAPKLPPGAALDLSAGTITVDNVDFAIPTSIVTGDTGAVRTAMSLSPVEWLTVVRNSRVLYGIDLERALSGAAICSAEHAALVWKVPANDDFVISNDDSRNDASVAYSVGAKNLASQQIVNLSLSASLPFVGAAADAERAERTARSELQKTLYMTGMWNYPRAYLLLNECTAIAPALLTALHAALDPQQHADGPSQFAALREVFSRFGHVVATRVGIGAQMHFEKDLEIDASVDDTTVTDAIKAAIDVEPGKSAGGGGVCGGAGFAAGNGKRVETQDITSHITWLCIGGDTGLIGDPNRWRDTIKDPSLWRVFEWDAVVSLVDRLRMEQPDLANAVEKVWTNGLNRFWDNHPLPPGYVLPPFGGEAFRMIRDIATNAPTISAKLREPMTTQMFEALPGAWGKGQAGLLAAVRTAIANNPGRKPYLNALDKNGADPGFGRLRVDTQGSYDPAGSQCLWQLRYTGACDASNAPYFWIEARHPDPPTGPFAIVVDINPLDDLDGEKPAIKAAALAGAPSWLINGPEDPLQPILDSPLIRPRLGYVMSDRVLTNPPLRLDDNGGVLDGAFWTVTSAPAANGQTNLYVFRSANGSSFTLSDPAGLQTGDEIHVWRNDTPRSVRCETATAASPS